MKTQCFHSQFQGIHSQLGRGAVHASKYRQTHRSSRPQVSAKRTKWKKSNGLLNALEHKVTGDIKVTSQTGHPHRKETVLAPSFSSPSSVQSCLFHSYQTSNLTYYQVLLCTAQEAFAHSHPGVPSQPLCSCSFVCTEHGSHLPWLCPPTPVPCPWHWHLTRLQFWPQTPDVGDPPATLSVPGPAGLSSGVWCSRSSLTGSIPHSSSVLWSSKLKPASSTAALRAFVAGSSLACVFSKAKAGSLFFL